MRSASVPRSLELARYVAEVLDAADIGRHWRTQDFASIADAIDAFFKSKGWM